MLGLLTLRMKSWCFVLPESQMKCHLFLSGKWRGLMKWPKKKS